MKNIQIILNEAIAFLQKNGIANSRVTAETLLAFVLKISVSDLYLKREQVVTNVDFDKFHELLLRRSKKEPLDYILGEINFFGCKFLVNSNVLIPRQETEILVDKVSDILKKEDLKGKTIFDICCGSGCIGISLKKKFNDLKIYLSDISKNALLVAKENAKKNSVNVFFKEGDLLNPFDNLKADYIVCNPPYISNEEFLTLDDDVALFEPKIALVAKDKGLEFYKRIEKDIFKYLNRGAKLFFEIGYMQKDDILKIFSSKKWKNGQVIDDFSNKNRFFFVEIE